VPQYDDEPVSAITKQLAIVDRSELWKFFLYQLPDLFISIHTEIRVRKSVKAPGSLAPTLNSPSSTMHTMAMYYGIVFGAVAAVYFSLQLLLRYTHDWREPRSIETLIPFVSPVIGMMRKKTKYYVMLR
jgi:hypothetical protein